MSSDDNNNDNVNWPTAFMYIGGGILLLLFCYGDKILDAITK